MEILASRKEGTDKGWVCFLGCAGGCAGGCAAICMMDATSPVTDLIGSRLAANAATAWAVKS
ncbi:hypothetical protein [Dictyoglomus thermophilum]|jgi:hypothetical protein|uniref:hypothetical protein n=1 Tax=Dictyoglomus thermophilum TaxID=14 RepID=UPI00031D8EB7|nr:hypothetical protein [Dictyoglomus thermophilum]TYT20336.1 hypothetical protein FY122_09400 [Dictyoglomus thermophilum]